MYAFSLPVYTHTYIYIYIYILHWFMVHIYNIIHMDLFDGTGNANATSSERFHEMGPGEGLGVQPANKTAQDKL